MIDLKCSVCGESPLWLSVKIKNVIGTIKFMENSTFIGIGIAEIYGNNIELNPTGFYCSRCKRLVNINDVLISDGGGFWGKKEDFCIVTAKKERFTKKFVLRNNVYNALKKDYEGDGFEVSKRKLQMKFKDS